MTAAPQTGEFARRYVPDLDLGDERRQRRFDRVIDRFALGAGESLPALFPDAKAHKCTILSGVSAWRNLICEEGSIPSEGFFDFVGVPASAGLRRRLHNTSSLPLTVAVPKTG